MRSGHRMLSLAKRQLQCDSYQPCRSRIPPAAQICIQASYSSSHKDSDKDHHHSSLGHKLTFFIQSLAAAYLFREHVCELTVCVGPSMMPTFNPRGDVALVEHISVQRQRITVGDVVIAKSVQNPRQVVCKRVLGLPGDRICSWARHGESHSYGLDDDECVVVPPGHVWLQGDNMMNSTDSRHYGPVPYATLKGRVVCRLYPDPKWI